MYSCRSILFALPFFVFTGPILAQRPNLGIVPAPQRIEVQADAYTVPTNPAIALSKTAGAGEKFAANELATFFAQQAKLEASVSELDAQRPANIYLGKPATDENIDRLAREHKLKLEPAMKDEGYALSITSDKIVLVADSDAGLLYGVSTLKQLFRAADKGTVPTATLHDWPAMKMRGVHDEISYGQVSTMDNFKDIIRFLADYKMNIFMIYLEDMFQFKSYPTIGVGRGALSRAQIDELEAFAKPYNVEIIPVFETLGNQGALLMLDEIRPFAEFPGAHSFSMEEPTYEFLTKCLDELTEAFDSKYFNAGLDESWDLGFGKTKERVKKEGRGAVHAAHYRRINDMLKARGKTMMMYADIILNRPEILKLIPKDIVLVDWHYEPSQHFPSVAKLRAAGFPLVTLPGMNNWDRIFPNQSYAMINIENFTMDGYRKGSLGSITSTWGDNGSKNLRELLYAGYAYTGQVTWSPEKSKSGEFYQNFFTQWNGPGTAESFQAIYALLEKWPWWYPLLDYFRDPFLPRKDLKLPQEEDLYHVEHDARIAEELAKSLKSKVVRRSGDLDYLIYCARMHQNYVKGQRLVRDLSQYPDTWTDGTSKDTAKQGFLTRATALRKETEELRDIYRELWLRTNIEANLHYCINDYDRVIKCWKDAEKRIEAGIFKYDPRTPAQWIYHPVGADRKGRVQQTYFRKNLVLGEEPLERAHLQIQGDTFLKIYVNGTKIGEQFARRNLSAPVNPKLVQLYDIKPHLKAGKNVIAIDAYNFGSENQNLEPGGPFFCAGFNLYGEIIPTGKAMIKVLSNESWKASDKDEDTWTQVDFDDANWPAAKGEAKPNIWITYPDFKENWPGYSAQR